jgi:hypothetical protein
LLLSILLEYPFSERFPADLVFDTSTMQWDSNIVRLVHYPKIIAGSLLLWSRLENPKNNAVPDSSLNLTLLRRNSAIGLLEVGLSETWLIELNIIEAWSFGTTGKSSTSKIHLSTTPTSS